MNEPMQKYRMHFRQAIVIGVALFIAAHASHADDPPTADELIESIPVLSDGDDLKNLHLTGIVLRGVQHRSQFELIYDGESTSFVIRNPYDFTPVFAGSGDRVLLFNTQSRQVIEIPSTSFTAHVSLDIKDEKNLAFALSAGAGKESNDRPIDLRIDAAKILARCIEKRKVTPAKGGRYRFEGQDRKQTGMARATIDPDADYPLATLSVSFDSVEAIWLDTIRVNQARPPELRRLPTNDEIEKHFELISTKLTLRDERVGRLFLALWARSAVIREGIYAEDVEQRARARKTAESLVGENIDWVELEKTVIADAKKWMKLLPRASDAEVGEASVEAEE